MMHVQLINESQYNKEHKIKIHSLCFYYRNHKHVLYGSFTINNEVFIFSFNIFDIYRSYHSKSNKKSSKSHKNSTTVNLQAVNKSSAGSAKVSTVAVITSIPPAVPTQTSTTSTNTVSTPPIPSTTSLNSTNVATSTSNKLFGFDDSSLANKINVELNKNFLNANNGEFTTYINDIVKSSMEEASKMPNLISDSPAEPSPPPAVTPAAVTLVNSDLTLTKTEKILNKLEAMSHQQNKISSLNSNSSINATKAISAPPPLVKPVNSSNLSNFLVVRFETCVNQDSSSSKAKSKYKKCIKIVSVSSKPLSYFETSAANAANISDIQLKTFEFTEKCLSFRLACLDLNTESRTNFDVKIINLYEKYLCAAINYKAEDQTNSFKLFKIKHEESNSNTNSNSNSNTTNLNLVSTDQKNVTKVVINETGGTSVGSTNDSGTNCLIATSSSRLNLTEFILNCFTTTNSNCRILSILPITVTTFDDEDDLHFVALLNDFGVISIIDPVKNCIVVEFPSVSSEDKFISLSYCYGLNFCILNL